MSGNFKVHRARDLKVGLVSSGDITVNLKTDKGAKFTFLLDEKLVQLLRQEGERGLEWIGQLRAAGFEPVKALRVSKAQATYAEQLHKELVARPRRIGGLPNKRDSHK